VRQEGVLRPFAQTTNVDTTYDIPTNRYYCGGFEYTV